ncbi:MAG: hypothetical protein ACOX81_08595 [Candidatus Heteroscillospira sp.]|jgi:hypothetical protein
MKKRKNFIPILIAAFLIVFILGYLLYSDRPFETITADEIKEIQVYAVPPDKEAALSSAEIESAVPILQNLKISRPGYKIFMAGTGGQSITFTILKSDGSKIELSNFGNVLIEIDGRSYHADYESAEALNEYANKVLKTGF